MSLSVTQKGGAQRKYCRNQGWHCNAVAFSADWPYWLSKGAFGCRGKRGPCATFQVCKMKAQVAWALQAQMLRSRHTFLSALKAKPSRCTCVIPGLGTT